MYSWLRMSLEISCRMLLLWSPAALECFPPPASEARYLLKIYTHIYKLPWIKHYYLILYVYMPNVHALFKGTATLRTCAWFSSWHWRRGKHLIKSLKFDGSIWLLWRVKTGIKIICKIIGRSKSVGCGSHGRDASEVWFEGRSGRKTHRKFYFWYLKRRFQNPWYSHSWSRKFFFV